MKTVQFVTVVGLDEGLVDFNYSSDVLKQQRDGVGVQHVGAFVRRLRCHGDLQVPVCLLRQLFQKKFERCFEAFFPVFSRNKCSTGGLFGCSDSTDFSSLTRNPLC